MRRLGAHKLASNRASQMRGSTRLSGSSGGRPEMVVNVAALGCAGGAAGGVGGAAAGAVAGAVVLAGAFAGGAISRAAMAAPMSM